MAAPLRVKKGIPKKILHKIMMSFVGGGVLELLTNKDFAKTRAKFLSDETKSASNTVCINEHFCEI